MCIFDFNFRSISIDISSQSEPSAPSGRYVIGNGTKSRYKTKKNHLNRINIDKGMCVLVMVGDNLRRDCVNKVWSERCGGNQSHRGGIKSEETEMRIEVKGVLLCSREGAHYHSGWGTNQKQKCNLVLSYVRVCGKCALYPAGMGLYPPEIEGNTTGVKQPGYKSQDSLIDIVSGITYPLYS